MRNSLIIVSVSVIVIHLVECLHPGPIPLSANLTPDSNPNPIDGKFHWRKEGLEAIDKAWRMKPNTQKARNIILFIGDGMGLSTITAARIFKGQQQENKSGEEGLLSFEKFPNIGLLKTYNTDRQIPDSAATATALFSGIKANFFTLGYTNQITQGVCPDDQRSAKKEEAKSILEWAMESGKSTGLVTTTRITHATPAAAYAHSPHRHWECDTSIPESYRENCMDIARQLVENKPGQDFNVIFGGGEQVLRSDINKTDSVCTRGDGKDLVWDWMRYQKSLNKTYSFVKNYQQMMEVNDFTDRVLGLFAPNHMSFDQERDKGPEGEPSLSQMTSKAIRILSKNPLGYVLIVEGGRIDHAHHENLATKALEEMLAFDLAINTAVESLENPTNTLVIVTADHSHSMSMSGYAKRGNPIQGVSDSLSEEGFPYETLSYINGPGYNYHRLKMDGGNNSKTANSTGISSLETWINLNLTKPILTAVGNSSINATAEALKDREIPHFAGFWNDFETHGGEDVPVYAKGSYAHLFHSVHEQTFVAYVIAYASCIGPYRTVCHNKKYTLLPHRTLYQAPRPRSGGSKLQPSLFGIVVLLITMLF